MNLLAPRLFLKPCWIALGLCALTAVGCGGGGSTPVQGTITLDGAPLAQVYLTLAPKDQQIEGPFTGETDSQGHFSLGPMDDPEGGVPPGEYQLAITTSRSDGMETSVPTPERVPADQRVRDLEVPEGGLPDLKIEMQSK
jgi:hypothetical protein